MKRSAVFILLLSGSLLPAFPALSQDFGHRVAVIGRAAWLHPTGKLQFDSRRDDYGAEFDSKVGFGLAVNVFLFHELSLEVGASIVKPDLLLVFPPGQGPETTRGLRMIPVTAALQFHFFPARRLDPYIGAGAAYIFFDDLKDLESLRNADVKQVDLKEHASWMANVGLNIAITPRFAFNVDAKYIDVEPETTVVFDRADFTSRSMTRFRPLIVAAGFAWRF
jgi:outer membrane protein W